MPENAMEPPFDCLAARWNGEPMIDGPHPPHPFTYGPDGMYHGHCGGRGDPDDWPATPELPFREEDEQ